MKKVLLSLVIFTLFVFVGCSDKKLDELDITDTGITDNPDTDNPDTENPDSTDTSDPDDPTNPDDPNNPTGDPENPTDNPADDPENPTDNPTDDPENPTDEPTGNPTDDPTDDPTNPTDPTDPTNPEMVCTQTYLYQNFRVYLKGSYVGQVQNGFLGDTAAFDVVTIDFGSDVEIGNTTYDLSSDDVTLTIIQDYGESTEKEYVQESGTITLSNYNPETFEMNAVISAKLVEKTPVEGASCVKIVSANIHAVDSGDKATCAEIMDCMNECFETNSTCLGNCYINGNVTAREQYNDLIECDEANHCEGNYYCYYEHCLAEEETCGMVNDPNYRVPYGEVTINGTFPYLFSKDETEIQLSSDYIIDGTFATGTFGNDENNLNNIVNPAGNPFAYAKIANFKDSPDTENITFVQTYKNDGVKSPVVHLVTTITEPGLDYTLGLGEWDTEARIFISEMDSDGNKICDHAFGVGNIKINDISWVLGATTISIEGSATLYSFKATPHYGGDVSGIEWVACDPQ